MTTAAQRLIRDLDVRGVRLSVTPEGRLRYDAPHDVDVGRLVRELQEHKAELVEAVAANACSDHGERVYASGLRVLYCSRCGHSAPPSEGAGQGPDPLPAVGDPRREPLALLDELWERGLRVVIEGDGADIRPREKVTAELRERFEVHRAAVVAMLTRMPRAPLVDEVAPDGRDGG